jgi:hypothetical protein
MKSIYRSMLAHALMTSVASLAFMIMGAARVHAETVIGAEGTSGDDCPILFGMGCTGGNAGEGESVSASGNPAFAVGGNGGNVGRGDVFDPDGNGGAGGSVAAFATGSSGNADVTVSASATGGNGSGSGDSELAGPGGDADAESTAMSAGSGAASSSASASGGSTGNCTNGCFKSGGGSANATSTATSTGSGAASSSATATRGFAIGDGGSASATANASASGGGTATTNAIAQGGSGQAFANPGQTAYAFSTALPDKAYAASLIGGASHVANALLGPRDAVFGTAILGANYAPDGGGESNTYSASSTFDFGYGGDLQLGLIDDQVSGFAKGLGFQSMEFTIEANGVEVLDVTFGSLAIAESFFRDDVIDLGADFGPNIDLTFGYTLIADGPGGFGFDLAIGGAVPEPSTWAMMLVGFGGLGFAGYRSTRREPPCSKPEG